jgi:V/A-type H+-transporting ATPase subunit I
MELLNLVVFKENAEKVVSHLLKLGIFHPVDARLIEREMEGLSPLEIQKEYAGFEALEITLRDILRKMRANLEPHKVNQVLTQDEIVVKLEEIGKALEPYVTKKDELVEELKTKESIFSQIKDYFPLPIKKGAYYTFLEVVLGKIEEKNLPVLEKSLKDVPHLVYPVRRENKILCLVIGLRRDRAYINKVLKDLSFEQVEYDENSPVVSRDLEMKLAVQIEEIKKNIEKANSDIKNFCDKVKESLSQIQASILLKKTIIEAKKYSYITEKTVLISGWIPQNELARVQKELKIADSTAYIEDRLPEDVNIPKDEIPVRLEHTKAFKPFELLIESYGLPRYGTIDPTIFVAISFLLMFGAMFGDLGHGIVMALVSTFLRRSCNNKVKQASALLLYCGISSAIFGVLYGSCFGYEFRSLWMKPMENILQAFKVSIIFGVVLMTLGIVLNLINSIRDKNYLKAVFDKAGLISGVIYWAGLGLVSKLFLEKEATVFPFFYLNLIIGGLLLLFFKPVIEVMFKHKNEGMFISFMESIIDMLEIVMGYLANTVSFIRVAAFSLAHAGLFLAIFELSGMLKDVGGGFLSMLVIIFGNILVILLEGLVVGIQSLRLNYYEFFSKFFESGKKAYKPLSI